MYLSLYLCCVCLSNFWGYKSKNNYEMLTLFIFNIDKIDAEEGGQG